MAPQDPFPLAVKRRMTAGGPAQGIDGQEENFMANSLLTLNEQTTAKADSRAGKYLVFCLGEEEFGIQVQKVREIMGVLDITQVPQTPPHVKGVINLRGKVIPVIDLRLKFSMPSMEYTHLTCIIVVQVAGDDGPVIMGIVVDGVAEVLQVAGSEIEDTPNFGKEVEVPYVMGMAKIKDKVKILLNIDQVMTARELVAFDLAVI
jgi:purine-binding chemotaxis protein CheW